MALRIQPLAGVGGGVWMLLLEPLEPLLPLGAFWDLEPLEPVGAANVVGAKTADPPSRQRAMAVELRWVRRFIVKCRAKKRITLQE